MRVGVFGGTFDPIHLGHLIAAEEICALFDVDKTYIIPAFIPPHKHRNDITAAHHRYNMVSLAASAHPRFVPSDFEIKRSVRSYTIDTVEHFSSEGDLYLIMGHDSFSAFETWRRFEDILKMCRIVLPIRPNSEPIDWSIFGPAITECRVRDRIIAIDSSKSLSAPQDDWKIAVVTIPGLDISSTEIRSRIASGRSIRYLVPKAVIDYIEAHGLYQDSQADRGF